MLIEGVRLRLRRAVPEDAEALFALADDEELMRYMDWPRAASVAQTRTHLEGAARRWDNGTEHQYLVLAKPAGQAIGSISFRPHGHAVDFGYLIGRAHWGQGLATEAVGLLVGWLQRQPAIVRVWATTDVDNARSAAVLRKAGLMLEGVMRRSTIRPQLGGAARDTALHAWVRQAALPPDEVPR
jgi:ribosomal-protein-alanine N-acetyltransferase